MKLTGAPRRSCSPCRKARVGCVVTPGATKCDKCVIYSRECTIQGKDYVSWSGQMRRDSTKWTSTTSWVSERHQTLYERNYYMENSDISPVLQQPNYTGPVPRIELLQDLYNFVSNQPSSGFFTLYYQNLSKIASFFTSLELEMTTLSWLITDYYFDVHHLINSSLCRSWVISGAPITSVKPPELIGIVPLWIMKPLLSAGIVLSCVNPLNGVIKDNIKLDKTKIESLYENMALTTHHIFSTVLQDENNPPLIPLDLLLEAMLTTQVCTTAWGKKRGTISVVVSYNLMVRIFYKYDLLNLDKYSSPYYPNSYIRDLWQPNMQIHRETLRRLILVTFGIEYVVGSNFDQCPVLTSRDVAGLKPPMPESMWVKPPIEFPGYPLGNQFMSSMEWMFLPRHDPIRKAGLETVADIINNESALLSHFSLILVVMSMEVALPKEIVLGRPLFPRDEATTMILHLIDDFVEALPEPLKSMYKADDAAGVKKLLSLNFHEPIVSRIMSYLLRIPDAHIRLMFIAPLGSLQPEWIRVAQVTRNLTRMAMNLPLISTPPPQLEVNENQWFSAGPGFNLEQVLVLSISASAWIKQLDPLSPRNQVGWGAFMLILRNALIFMSLSRILNDKALQATTQRDAMSMLRVLAEINELERPSNRRAHDQNFEQWAPGWIKSMVKCLDTTSSVLTTPQVIEFLSERFRDELQ